MRRGPWGWQEPQKPVEPKGSDDSKKEESAKNGADKVESKDGEAKSEEHKEEKKDGDAKSEEAKEPAKDDSKTDESASSLVQAFGFTVA